MAEYIFPLFPRVETIVALPSVCGDCLFLNCCTWIGNRDCMRCVNRVSKDEYLRRINQRIRPAKREGATM